MGVVDVCPRRQIDITTASKKLGCKNDTYGNNKYMCVPKDDKSSLVEICYDGNMGIEEPGACLEATHGGIRRFNCSGFMYGCPDDPFHRYNVYKYPACQDINVRHRCYVLDPSCPSQSSGNGILYAVIGVLIVGILISVGVYIIRKCLSKKEPATGVSQPTDVTEQAEATKLFQRTDVTDSASGLPQSTDNIEPDKGLMQSTNDTDLLGGKKVIIDDLLGGKKVINHELSKIYKSRIEKLTNDDVSSNIDENLVEGNLYDHRYPEETKEQGSSLSTTPQDTCIHHKYGKFPESFPNNRGHCVQNMQKDRKFQKKLRNNQEHDVLNMQTAQAHNSEENRKILKVLCRKTQIQKGVILVDHTMNELTKICAGKFGLDEEELQSMHFVLNEDGTEIDDEYLQTLENDTLLILQTHEQLSLC